MLEHHSGPTLRCGRPVSKERGLEGRPAPPRISASEEGRIGNPARAGHTHYIDPRGIPVTLLKS